MDRRVRFTLTRTRRAKRTQEPQGVPQWARSNAQPATTPAWADLTESVRTGRSAFRRVHGWSVWEWFAAHPDEERLFAASMRRLTEHDAPAIVTGYPWPVTGTVCDVAGGVGTLLAAILQARPGLRGVLVDAPGVLAEAEPHLVREGVRDRVELRDGDIFGAVDAQADVYVLKDILHDWDDAASARILGAVRAAMPAGSRLVLVETLQERNRPRLPASIVDIQMLTQCEEGRQRSAAELRALLAGAGLRPGEVRETAGPALVEAVAP
jgi:hypothetical protein